MGVGLGDPAGDVIRVRLSLLEGLCCSLAAMEPVAFQLLRTNCHLPEAVSSLRKGDMYKHTCIIH